MTKNVQQKFRIFFQPSLNLAEKLGPVSHVLEHFNRNDAIKGLIWIIVIHIRCDDLQILKFFSYARASMNAFCGA